MNQKALFSSQNPSWSTPQELFDELDGEFHFTLDPCADDGNHKCDRYYTEEQDGLAQDWSGETVFCNPPYGRAIGRWVEKAFREVYAGQCRTAVLLLPARTETMWFHDYIYHRAEVRFIKGRLRFEGAKDNAPFPSMVVIFRGKEKTNVPILRRSRPALPDVRAGSINKKQKGERGYGKSDMDRRDG